MNDVGHSDAGWLQSAAVFGASGGIGSALCKALAERGIERIFAGSRKGKAAAPHLTVPFAFDLTDEDSIEAAADKMRDDPPQLVVVATGALTLPDGTGPERSYKRLDVAAMEQALRLNTVGPALIAKHMLPLFPRQGRAVFAVLSARVGSISDNRIGGWHSYRASKAALNMLVRNWAIELGRTHKDAVVVSLHPGTVDTALSEPFQSGLPSGQLTPPEKAAANLLRVIDDLVPEQTGGCYDWKGEPVPE